MHANVSAGPNVDPGPRNVLPMTVAVVIVSQLLHLNLQRGATIWRNSSREGRQCLYVTTGGSKLPHAVSGNIEYFGPMLVI